MPLKITLAAVNHPLRDAWEKYCGDLEFVDVHYGSILDVSCDSIVSPANSFGFMDGGIDAAYSAKFGPGLQRRLQLGINAVHGGELLVGQAYTVATSKDNKADQCRLIAAPTMRVPMKLPADTVNPYLAARAVFRLVLNYPPSKVTGVLALDRTDQHIAFPGLGTGIGGVPPEVCARQVRQAIEDVVLNRFEPPKTWIEASVRHQALYTEASPTDLQHL